MKSRQNYYERLELFQNYLKYNNKVRLKDFVNHFHKMPYGTISATLSFMYMAGHLTKNENNEYSLPSVVSSAKQIASDITKMLKAKKSKPEPSKINGPLNLFKGEEFETIQVKIQNAIELLKSNGYKILAKKTEYTEI